MSPGYRRSFAAHDTAGNNYAVTLGEPITNNGNVMNVDFPGGAVTPVIATALL